jgi:hypothetical protein
MLTTHRKSLFWLSVALLFVGVAFLLLPPYASYCESNYPNEDYCSAYSVAVTLANIVDAHNGAFTALATIAIASFNWTLWQSTEKLWIAGEKQRKLAEETAERQLRAYVFIDGGSIQIRRTEKGRIFLTGYVEFKKFGQTPAYNVNQWVRMEIFDNEPDNYCSATGITNSAIGPGGTTVSPVNQGVSESDIQDINARRKIVSVWGEIAYIDAFGKRQSFRFYNRNGEPIPGKGWQLTKANKPDEAS